VLNSVDGAWSWWPFFIENWSLSGIQQVDLTFDLSRLSNGTEVVVEIPGIVDMALPNGVDRSEIDGWTVLDFGPSVGSVVSEVNLGLEAGQRLRAILRMKLPQSTPATLAEMLMTEIVNGEEVGGVVFEARAGDLKEHVCRSIQTLASIFERLAMAIDDPAAASQFGRIAQMRLQCRQADLMEVFTSIQQLYADLLMYRLDNLISEVEIYKERYRAAAGRFMAVDTEIPGERTMRLLVESAAEQSLYAWLILGEIQR
jgi:hypothetical protein